MFQALQDSMMNNLGKALPFNLLMPGWEIPSVNRL